MVAYIRTSQLSTFSQFLERQRTSELPIFGKIRPSVHQNFLFFESRVHQNFPFWSADLLGVHQNFRTAYIRTSYFFRVIHRQKRNYQLLGLGQWVGYFGKNLSRRIFCALCASLACFCLYLLFTCPENPLTTAPRLAFSLLFSSKKRFKPFSELGEGEIGVVCRLRKLALLSRFMYIKAIQLFFTQKMAETSRKTSRTGHWGSVSASDNVFIVGTSVHQYFLFSCLQGDPSLRKNQQED